MILFSLAKQKDSLLEDIPTQSQYRVAKWKFNFALMSKFIKTKIKYMSYESPTNFSPIRAPECAHGAKTFDSLYLII